MQSSMTSERKGEGSFSAWMPSTTLQPLTISGTKVGQLPLVGRLQFVKGRHLVQGRRLDADLLARLRVSAAEEGQLQDARQVEHGGVAPAQRLARRGKLDAADDRVVAGIVLASRRG